jgi:hypothetical protein
MKKRMAVVGDYRGVPCPVCEQLIAAIDKVINLPYGSDAMTYAIQELAAIRLTIVMDINDSAARPEGKEGS